MQKEIKQTWHFNSAPREVWDYLTKPELLEQWLMKNDFKPVVGHQFRFTTGSGKVIDCEVLEVKPFTSLSYRWQSGSAVGNTRFDTKVEWTLIPTNTGPDSHREGTELVLVHNGFTALEDINDHNKGWATLGKRFVDLLTTIKK